MRIEDFLKDIENHMPAIYQFLGFLAAGAMAGKRYIDKLVKKHIINPNEEQNKKIASIEEAVKELETRQKVVESQIFEQIKLAVHESVHPLIEDISYIKGTIDTIKKQRNF